LGSLALSGDAEEATAKSKEGCGKHRGEQTKQQSEEHLVTSTK